MKQVGPIVDLSLPIEEGMMYYPSKSHIPFHSEKLGQLESEGRETHAVRLGTHCGTHVDGFSHFLSEGTTIDQLPLNHLIGPAFLMNLGTLDPGLAISASMLEPHLRADSYEKVVLRTDWSRFWGESQYYQNWPYLTDDAARFLISKGIHLLGMDFPSPDSVYNGDDRNKDCPMHKLFFSSDVVLVEYLTNLKSLSAGSIFFMAHPLKLVGLDGSPARVTAFNLGDD